MTYVISDIHGQYDAFIKILEKISFSDKDTLYILGDIIDRGSKSVEIYNYIKGRKNIILLRGNHEQMMIDYYRNHCSKYHKQHLLNIWVDNGGNKTIAQLESMKEDEECFTEEMLSFIENTPFYAEVKIKGKEFLLCHAGLIYRGELSLEENIEFNKKRDSIIWRRVPTVNTGKYIIVHGHTQSMFWFGDDTIVSYNEGKAINIDCGAARKSRLGCLCLDNLKAYFVEIGTDCIVN